MMEALEKNNGPKFDTCVQSLLDKYNKTCIVYAGNFANQIELIAKEFANASHLVSDKMLMTKPPY